jgi:hypothetical protein
LAARYARFSSAGRPSSGLGRHGKICRPFEHHLVSERDGLQHRIDIVIAVRAQRADGEVQIDLGGCADNRAIVRIQ